MSDVRFENILKTYPNGVRAVAGFDLQIASGELVVFVGPSGCGKSTLLRMVAGIESITSGTIAIDGRVVNDDPPRRRNVAMVMQHYALYPHRNVRGNLAFGLKLRGDQREQIDTRIAETTAILGIDHLLDRRPATLSGGEQQRVALGRAMVRRPAVFLLDEPLSNLDAKLRSEMRVEIKRLHRRVDATMIYVTHDQTEAMTLGDRVVVLHDGAIQQVADPITLYDRPANRFVAEFIGTPSMNFVEGIVDAEDEQLVVRADGFSLPVPNAQSQRLAAYRGRSVLVGIRPEHVHLAENGSIPHAASFGAQVDINASFGAQVDIVEPLGAESLVHLNIDGTRLVVRADSHEQLAPSGSVRVAIPAEKAHFFDPATEEAIK